MTLEPGCIVLVPFPYTDLSVVKKRPVLLLTPVNERGDFIGMALTSKTQANSAIGLPAGSLPLGGALPVPSWIRPDKVITLRDTVASKVLGRVDESTRLQCVQQLCRDLKRGH